MGFNTIIMILNDQFGALERQPDQFVSTIKEGFTGRAPEHNVTGQGNGPASHNIGQTTVFPSKHADRFQVVVSHGNLALRLTSSEDTLERLPDRYLQALLEYSEVAENLGTICAVKCRDLLRERGVDP